MIQCRGLRWTKSGRRIQGGSDAGAAGVQITRYDRELESLLAELAQKQAWHKTILDKKRDLDIELQAARTQLAELKGRSPLLFRSSHESRIHEAEESKNHLERELVAATLNAVLARNKVVEIHDKLDDAVREMKDLRSRMLDCKTNYCMLPESMIGMSRLWECLNGRIRLFKAEGAISSVYRPLALIGNSGGRARRAPCFPSGECSFRPGCYQATPFANSECATRRHRQRHQIDRW